MKTIEGFSNRFTPRFKMNFLKLALAIVTTSFIVMIVSVVIPITSIPAMLLSFAMLEVILGMMFAVIAYMPISTFLGYKKPEFMSQTQHYAGLGVQIVGMTTTALALTWMGIHSLAKLLDAEMGYFLSRTVPSAMLLILAAVTVCLTIWVLWKCEKAVWQLRRK